MLAEQNNKRSGPAWEDMSTGELKELLAMDLEAPEGEELTTGQIIEILEVIERREPEIAEKFDADAAWRDFQAKHLGQAPFCDTDQLPEPDSSHPIQIEDRQIPGKKSLRFKIAVLVAAALALLLCGTAMANGLSVFQTIAKWGAETFGFAWVSNNERESGADATEYDPFRALRMAVAEESDVQMIPTWAPNGTEVEDNVSVIERSDGLRIQGTYNIGQEQYTIRINLYKEIPEVCKSLYEKDGTTVTEYEAGGIVHFIMDNNGKTGVVWTNENAEGTIQGNLSIPDLKKMIDSIYEE